MLEDLSIGKILLILVVVMIFFGPKKIPDLAQSIGKGIREFKKAMRDVSDEVKKPAEDQPQNSGNKMLNASQQGTGETAGSSGSQQSTTSHKP